jgi:hypothetical protein
MSKQMPRDEISYLHLLSRKQEEDRLANKQRKIFLTMLEHNQEVTGGEKYMKMMTDPDLGSGSVIVKSQNNILEQLVPKDTVEVEVIKRSKCLRDGVEVLKEEFRQRQKERQEITEEEHGWHFKLPDLSRE